MLRRVVALIMVLILPISLIVSIVLGLMNHPYAPLAFGFAFATMLVYPVFYVITVMPKHVVEVYFKLKDKLK